MDVRALGPAEDAGIVNVDAAGQIEFAHPLFASAALSLVTVARRRELHRQAADRSRDPEQRARHLALGAEHPDPAVADRLDEAAVLAASRGATDAAAELTELAVAQTPPEHVDAREQRRLAAASFSFRRGRSGAG